MPDWPDTTAGHRGPHWPSLGTASPSWGHHQAAAPLGTALLAAGAEADEAEAEAGAAADAVAEAVAEAGIGEGGEGKGQPGPGWVPPTSGSPGQAHSPQPCPFC
jgi:hypothetical protein